MHFKLPALPVLSKLLFVAFCGVVLFGAVCVFVGFPPVFWGVKVKLKNLHTLFDVALILLLAAWVFNPARKEKWERAAAFFASRTCFIGIAAIYAVLFVWQQVSEYLAVDINFIPFSFYSYMLYYFPKGLWTYTHLLHGYYHANLIMILFEPIWLIFKSPFVLVLLHGLVAVAAAFPLYALVRRILPNEPCAPNLFVFLFLNSKLLQSVLKMNFGVEIFYSLFVFLLALFALRKQWVRYSIALLLMLLVKEDAFVYSAGLGFFVFFVAGKRAGILTVIASVVYFGVLSKLVLPFLGSDILSASVRNYSGHGDSMGEIVKGLLMQPWKFITIFFDHNEKLKTWVDISSRLFFLPFLSPWAILLFVPLFPLFLHSHGDSSDFVSLHFHYAAAVLPFVFLTAVYGARQFLEITKRFLPQFRFLAVVGALALIFVNGGAYASRPWSAETLRSIAWAKSIPADGDVITHGHLMPYVGYRKNNFYMASVWEAEDHPAHAQYRQSRYVSFDLSVNPYPFSLQDVEQRLSEMKSNPEYRLIQSEEKRFLFLRNDSESSAVIV